VTALDEAPVMAGPGRTDDVALAEKELLASMIASRQAAEDALDMFGPDDPFGDNIHRAVYAAVRWLTEEAGLDEPGNIRLGTAGSGPLAADSRVDESAQRRFAGVLNRLVTTEQGIWRTGQAAVILGSVARHATPAWRSSAAVVMRAAAVRRTLEALETARLAVSRPGWDPGDGGDQVRKLVDGALGADLETSLAVTAADLFDETVARLEAGEAPGVIRFPWKDLQELVPWLRPGQLVTVAARPSLGKSLVAGDLARFTSIKRQIASVLFTMEMDRSEVMDRLIAAEAGVLLEKITGCALDDAEWDRIARARDRFSESKLIIDDTPRATIAHIRARLRGMARREPAQLAIVDYLQLMAPPKGGDNRQQEVSALVGSLKAIAREFRIPVVMLCQLNRGPEQRQDKRPYLSDARESGSVDNDSDIAILIHREDFYDRESPRAGEADLIVDKNRNGRRGTATVGFHGRYARFVDLAWTPSAAALKDES
jgi:replicative DNA helicase